MVLSAKQFYTLSSLPELEADVSQQVAMNAYDLDACLGVLRYYTFDPSKINVVIMRQILIKALMQLPRPDFAICTRVLPLTVRQEESISQVLQIAGLLEDANYGDFWAACRANASLFSPVKGFNERVQEIIVNSFANCCQRAAKATLQQAVNMDDAAFKRLLESQGKAGGWKVVSSKGGDLIEFPENAFNKHQEKSMQQHIKVDQIPYLFSRVAA